MPKRNNNETSIEENTINDERSQPETRIDNGEASVTAQYAASDERLGVSEQAERQRNSQAQHNQHPQSSQQNRGGSNQNNSGAAQSSYQTWESTMQTQSNTMHDQPSMSSSQLSNAMQQGGNYLQMMNLGDAKRLVSLLGGVYLAIYGLSRSLGSLLMASAGLGLLYYAVTGQWPLNGQGGDHQSHQGGRSANNTHPINALRSAGDATTTTKNMVVKAPLNEVYQAWANFENFPHFMQHIKSVRKTGDRTSHWTMEGPLNTQIEWDAETTRLDEDKRIAWSSITGDIKTSGQVTFNQLPNDEVEVTVMLKYVPPAGLAGNIVAEVFGNPEGKLLEDLRNFKRYIEQRQPQPA